MVIEFEKKYEILFKSLNGFNPEDEDWFLSALCDLNDKYGHDVVCKFVKKDTSAIYTTAICIKAGLKGVDKNLLIEYTMGDDEDDVYDAAVCLAIYGHEEGFEILNQFVNKTHKLSKNIDPFGDIIPDLVFIKNEKAIKLERYIRENK